MTEAKKSELFSFLRQNSILKDIPIDLEKAYISATTKEHMVSIYQFRRTFALDQQNERILKLCNDILAALANMQGEELYLVCYNDDLASVYSLVDEAVKTIYLLPVNNTDQNDN